MDASTGRIGGRPRAALWRATKIVATIGPSAERAGVLVRLLKAGVDVVRLNGAHCRPGDIRRRVALVRRAERAVGRPVGVLLDLGGPKIRLGPVTGGPVTVGAGEVVELTPRRAARARPDACRRFHVTYGGLLSDVSAGAEVRIDDGKVRLQVVAKGHRALRARVLAGGVLRTGAGVNFPDSAISSPSLTGKDRRDLKEGLAAGIDLVGLSFVRRAADLAELRRALARIPEARRPWVVAKIERPEALSALEPVAAASDALMVARGDLGVEIGLAAVPEAQRRILEEGRRFRIPVIVATQMLESMIGSPVPTRAEVSDVAGAVHGGADAVMLSGETAVGRFPVEAVRTMAEIARTAERSGATPGPGAPAAFPGETDVTAAVAEAAAAAARAARAAAVVVYTESGRTARLVSKLGLDMPVVAFTTSERVRRRMTLLCDVVSFRIPQVRSVEAMLRAGDRLLARVRPLAGATVVEVSGTAPAEGATNAIRIRRIRGRRR